MSVAPIHVARIDGAPVRFYRPPSQAGGPGFAWVDDRDLVAALTRTGMPVPALQDGIAEEEWGDVVVTAGPEGLILMLPPRLAFRLVLARSRFDGDDRLVFAFGNASLVALEALTATMSPEEARAYALAVFSRCW